MTMTTRRAFSVAALLAAAFILPTSSAPAMARPDHWTTSRPWTVDDHGAVWTISDPLPAPAVTPHAVNRHPRRHVVRWWLVQPGQTLSGISASTGVPVARIAARNGITDPDMIRSGARLVIRP